MKYLTRSYVEHFDLYDGSVEIDVTTMCGLVHPDAPKPEATFNFRKVLQFRGRQYREEPDGLAWEAVA